MATAYRQSTNECDLSDSNEEGGFEDSDEEEEINNEREPIDWNRLDLKWRMQMADWCNKMNWNLHQNLALDHMMMMMVTTMYGVTEELDKKIVEDWIKNSHFGVKFRSGLAR